VNGRKAARATTVALLALALRSASLASEPPAEPGSATTITTFAGTGRSGNADGPLATATFGSPSGLAVGAHGQIYVVDKALNTLRVIEYGAVRTLVGSGAGDPVWRAGGYANGPLASAAFNHPEGVAVGPDGSVIVADTLNAAVRRVKDGVVTTIAGGPGSFGAADGPVASAQFKFPVSVAVDAAGDIYVADQQTGVREISTGGFVRTLPIPDVANVTAVALGEGATPRLYVAHEGGLVRWDIAKGAQERRFLSAPDVRDYTEWPDAHAQLGRPYALAADGRFNVAYTDVSDNTIHRLDDGYARGIAGGDPFDPNFSGGYADGTGPLARFYAPLAIAKVTTGWLVADAGNHRLRSVSGIDDRQAVGGDGDHMKQYYSGKRPAVALVGSSEVWYDTDFATSIAGVLHGLLPGYDIVPMALVGTDDPGAAAQFCSLTVLPLEKIDRLVYVFNDTGITKHGGIGYSGLRNDAQWPLDLATSFAAARKILGSDASRVTVVYAPNGYEASPNEFLVEQQLGFDNAVAQYGDIGDFHARVAAVIARSGFDFVDAWPAFRDAEREGRGPLFGPYDAHLGPKGRALLGQLVYQLLRQRHAGGTP